MFDVIHEYYLNIDSHTQCCAPEKVSGLLIHYSDANVDKTHVTFQSPNIFTALLPMCHFGNQCNAFLNGSVCLCRYRRVLNVERRLRADLQEHAWLVRVQLCRRVHT